MFSQERSESLFLWSFLTFYCPGRCCCCFSVALHFHPFSTRSVFACCMRACMTLWGVHVFSLGRKFYSAPSPPPPILPPPSQRATETSAALGRAHCQCQYVATFTAHTPRRPNGTPEESVPESTQHPTTERYRPRDAQHICDVEE